MSDLDELLPITGLDQPLPFETEALYLQVEKVIEQAIEERDPEVAFEAGTRLLCAGRLAGMGLVKLSFELASRWSIFNIDEKFEDYAATRWGLSKTTIQRYYRVQSMLSSGEVPEEVAKIIEQRPIKDQSAIATAWASGYEFKDKDWDRLANAPDNSTVLEELRIIKDAPPRKNQLTLRLSRDGNIYAYLAGMEGVFVGYLNVDEAEDNEVVQKSIERICNNTGIMRE